MESTVKGGIKDGRYGFVMDEIVNELRKDIWKIIFQYKGKIPYADIGMALGIVQYELLHHSDEEKS